jgi:hypothetical protein
VPRVKLTCSHFHDNPPTTTPNSTTSAPPHRPSTHDRPLPEAPSETYVFARTRLIAKSFVRVEDCLDTITTPFYRKCACETIKLQRLPTYSQQILAVPDHPPPTGYPLTVSNRTFLSYE